MGRLDPAGVLDAYVREIPDWPQPGVTFRDLTPLLASPEALRLTIEALVALVDDVAGGAVDKVVGIEARGFLFGTPVAMALGVGFVPIRKAGKLPAATYQESYALEYGTAILEIHQDALVSGERVVVLDDVLATGGTLTAANQLASRCGADVAADIVLIELEALAGRARLSGTPLGALRTL